MLWPPGHSLLLNAGLVFELGCGLVQQLLGLPTRLRGDRAGLLGDRAGHIGAGLLCGVRNMACLGAAPVLPSSAPGVPVAGPALAPVVGSVAVAVPGNSVELFDAGG